MGTLLYRIGSPRRAGPQKFRVPHTRCRQCGRPVSWAGARLAQGRLRRLGLTGEEAAALWPLCGRCVSEYFEVEHGTGD